MKNQTVIAQTFLYKWRYVLAYAALALVFVGLTALLPLFTPGGLSTAEMESATAAYELKIGSFTPGNVLNMPYLLLQKASIHLFGMSVLSIKLPSIVLALISGLLIVLLLSHWFKKNVAAIASGLILSAGVFLTVAGHGTADIMYVFWPALILWLGFKAMSDKRSLDIYDVALYMALALSLYTPYMVYAVAAMVVTVAVHPHLRFLFKQLPQFWHWVALGAAVVVSLPLIISTIFHFNYNAVALLFGPGTDMRVAFSAIPGNLRLSFRQLFSFQTALDSPIVTPGFGLPMFILSGLGFFGLLKERHSAKNYFLYLWLLFVGLVMALAPAGLGLIVLPAAILVAGGIDFILRKWYGTFPLNPYARVLGLLPVAALLIAVVVGNVQYFAYGGMFVPQIADHYSQDLALLKENAADGSLVLVPEGSVEQRFYRAAGTLDGFTVDTEVPSGFAGDTILLSPSLYAEDFKRPENLQLARIVTSSRSNDGDRLYIYRNSAD